MVRIRQTGHPELEQTFSSEATAEARATWALNAGVWVRRVRRADFFTIENS